jgi:hypothetical protein
MITTKTEIPQDIDAYLVEQGFETWDLIEMLVSETICENKQYAKCISGFIGFVMDLVLDAKTIGMECNTNEQIYMALKSLMLSDESIGNFLDVLEAWSEAKINQP